MGKGDWYRPVNKEQYDKNYELIFSCKEKNMNDENMRIFTGGATRDTNIGKLDYEGFFSPIVLERYAQYLHKHRIQSDGKLRDADNWQGMFGEHHYNVCMKSGWRHFMDWWLEHRGYHTSKDGIEDAICGLIFNCQAYLFKMLQDKYNESNKK